MIHTNTFHTLKRRISLLLGITLVLSSCKHSFPEVPQEALGDLQDADIDHVVFIGSSMLAGIENGALTRNSTRFSVPQIVLNHLGETEEQTNFSPVTDSENGFNIYEQGLAGQYHLFYPTLDTAFDRRTAEGEAFQYANAGESIRNYSFPQAQILDFIDPSRVENTFVTSFFSGTNQALSNRIATQQPSLFLINLGYEDLLGYAIGGAEGTLDVSAASHTYQDILLAIDFEQRLESFTNELLDGNNKGALFNIPDFLLFPFFTKVRRDVTPYLCEPNFEFTDCTPTPVLDPVRSSAAAYNSLLTTYYNNNPGIPFDERRPSLDFGADAVFNWGILVEDRTLADVSVNGTILPKVRHMGLSDVPFYNVESKLDESIGIFPGSPVDERNYLRLSELQDIQDRIDAYNQAIENVVAQSNGQLVLIDVKALFDQLYEGFDVFLNQPANGILIEGVPFLPVVGEFGIFSADGLNLNARGNALLANFIIDQLNTAFNGNLKGINPNEFPGTPILSPD